MSHLGMDSERGLSIGYKTTMIFPSLEPRALRKFFIIQLDILWNRWISGARWVPGAVLRLTNLGNVLIQMGVWCRTFRWNRR